MLRSIVACGAWLASVGLLASGALIGCNAATAGGSGQGSPVASSGGDGGGDGGAAEAASDGQVGSGAGDGGLCADAGAAPQGIRLVSSATASVLGLTRDDEVVYLESGPGTLFAVPAAGGPPALIGPSQGLTGITGQAVVDWNGSDPASGIASLRVWTSAHGSQALADASVIGAADCSDDGASVVYLDGASGSTADLYVASTDGSSKTKLASGLAWSDACMPHVAFVGTSVLVGQCAPAGGGAPGGTLELYYAGASEAPTTLSTSAVLASVQIAGDKVLFADATGLVLGKTAAGTRTVLDAEGGAGIFTSDGQNVVYVASDGSIRRSSVTSPAPTLLVDTGGFGAVTSLSPDGRWLLASRTVAPGTGAVDIYVASATAPGPAAAVLGTATGSFFGTPFSADSSRILYVDGASNGVGTYHAAPTTGGPGVTVAARTLAGLATTRTEVVVEDQYVAGVGPRSKGVADIEAIDLSAASPAPRLLVSRADPGLYLTSAGDRLVYSVTACAPGSEGIWTMPAR